MERAIWVIDGSCTVSLA